MKNNDTRNRDTKRIVYTLLGTIGAITLGAIGFNNLDNKIRNDQLSNFQSQAVTVRSNYFNGNGRLAREQYENMWESINQTRRDGLRDFTGQITDKEMKYMVNAYNWETITDNSKRFPPLVSSTDGKTVKDLTK